MAEVKRWNRGGRLFRGAMVEVGDGDWVEYSDYATLEDERNALAAEFSKLRAENSTLRTLVAVQPTPCVYCGLTEMAKCASGFPGCARADDMICGEDETFKAVVDERNKLRAACAAKDAALRSARELLHSSEWPSLCNNIDTALSDTAGTNWVDATGAVKAKVLRQTAFGNAWLEWTPMPADWAGAPVKIVRVKP